MTPSRNNMPIGITELCPTVTDGWQLTLPVNMTIYVGRVSHIQKKKNIEIYTFIYIYTSSHATLSEYPIIDFNYLPIIKYPYHIVDICWLYSNPPANKNLILGCALYPVNSR